MNPETSNTFERAPDRVPTQEEVALQFRELIKGEYQEVRKCEDEQGLYLWQVVVPGEAKGETTEYSYIRRGSHKEVSSSGTKIYVVYYEDGIPVGGKDLANFNEGTWDIG